MEEDYNSEITQGKIALTKQGMVFYQFELKKAVVLLGKYLDTGMLSSYKDNLDIDEDSESDNRSRISEEEIGVAEEDNEFILFANEDISLNTIVQVQSLLKRLYLKTVL